MAVRNLPLLGLGVTAGGIDPQPPPLPGFIRFRAVDDPDVGLVAELNGVVTPAGYGAQEVTDRKGRVGITSYAGRQPITLPIPLLLDRWQTRESVEAELKMLDTMLGMNVNVPEPPALIVEGIGVPFSYARNPRLRWVLTGDPDWGDIRYGDGGQRSYVPVTVTAMQVSKPSTLTRAVKPPDHRKRQFHVVPSSHGKLGPDGLGGTLREIARGWHTTWQALRTLNPDLPADPDVVLPQGTVVRV